MPGGFLEADIGFPKLDGPENTDEKLKAISDYLFLLREQLRYTLFNLDAGNFNEKELGGMIGVITQPISIRIDEVEEGLSSWIDVTAAAIQSEATRAAAAEGVLSSRITQTAESITAEVTRATAAEGVLTSSISQTAAEIKNTVAASGTWYLNTYRADLYGYGAPDAATYPPAQNAGKYYLDQSSGRLYYCNGSAWSYYTSLSSVQSVISQQATEISSRITSAAAQTLISQNLSTITLSAVAGSNQSTVTITAGGITVDSAVVRFSNIVADSVVANSSITAPNIYGGTFYNSAGGAHLSLGGGNYGDLTLYSSSGQASFKVEDQGSYINMYAIDTYNFLTANAIGRTVLNGTGQVKVYVSTAIRLYCSNGRYWEFTSSGITFCDTNGTVLNSVVLSN